MLDTASLDAHAERIARDGWTILENVIAPDLVDAIATDLERLEKSLGIENGKNLFEGFHTKRVYNLLAHGPVWERIPVHDAVLPLVERVLDAGCLVSSLSSIRILPGERAQPIHADDQIMPLAKPHVATVCNTMWAITDFTDENGATRIVPGTHLADRSPNPLAPHETIPAEMSRGSVLVWHGSLWHGGGANRTDRARLGIAMNYCAGWVRQQENQQLGIPLETVRSFSPRLRELVGFGVYRALMGHIVGQTPEQAVLGEGEFRGLVWDRAMRPR